MAIADLNALLAGMRPPQRIAKATLGNGSAGRPMSTWYAAGIPAAGAAPSSSTAGGATLVNNSMGQVAGSILRADPGSGNAYLAGLSMISSQIGQIVLCDRLLHCGAISAGSAISITSTSAQTIGTTTLPARDNNGATNGEGVLCGIEVSTVTGAGTPTLTVGYTNSDGTSGRTGTNIVATTAASAVGSFHEIGLQANDKGVRSVDSLTLSATWTSGALAVVLYRILATVEVPAAYAAMAMDAITLGMPQLFPGTTPMVLFVPGSASGAAISGKYLESWG